MQELHARRVEGRSPKRAAGAAEIVDRGDSRPGVIALEASRESAADEPGAARDDDSRAVKIVGGWWGHAIKLECRVHDRPLAPVTSRELLLFVAALAFLVALLPLLGGGVLWTRPLWIDELCCTVYPVIDAQTPGDVVATIAHAKGDYAPPLLHLMVWSAARLFGGITPVLLRSMSLGCVALALLLVYVILRRRFEQAPALAGTLAVATHSLVLAHAFEGRFYGPWLLFATGYAWSLGLARPRRRALALSAFAMLLVSIHWFGVLSLGLMSAAAFATRGRRWREGLHLIAPSITGLIVLLAFVPFVLAQRATASGVLWVLPLSGAQIRVFVDVFVLATAPVLAVVLLTADAVRSDGGPTMTSNVAAALRDPALAALGSLALMPLVLIVVSVALQPSMLDRYAIVTVLAWAPLVALGVATLGRWARRGIVVVLTVMVVFGVRRTIAEKRAFAAVVRANAAAFAQATSLRLPIAFQSLLAVYPVAGPDRLASARFLDLPDSTINALVPQPRLHRLRRNLTLDRNIARGHARAYGFPTIVTQAELDTTPRFLLIASSPSWPVEKFGDAVFPRHRLRRLSDHLSLLERVGAASP